MNMERFFKKEVLRLKNVCSDLFNTYQSLVDKFVKLNQENEQLKQQIEKMKFCQNCKYGRALSYEEPCLYCSRCFANEGKEGLKDYWELAE